MTSNLTIVSPRGYRVILRVSNTSPLCLPFEEACNQFGLQPSWFGLKHLKRCLDISTTIRQSNLPNNCTLELCRLEKERVQTAVRVALQLPDSSRLMGVYEADCSLWEVLSTAESGEGYTSPLCYPGGHPATVPCLEYTKIRVIGEEELRSKSLKNLGILSGSAIIRYTTVCLEDVPKTISQDMTVIRGHQPSGPASQEPDVVVSKPEFPPELSTGASPFPSPLTSQFGPEVDFPDPQVSQVMNTPWSFDQRIEAEQRLREQEKEAQQPLFSNPNGWDYDKGPFENINLDAILIQALIPQVPPEEDYIAQFNVLHSEKTHVEQNPDNDDPVTIPPAVPLTDPIPKHKPIERVYDEACPRDTCVFHLDKNEYSDVMPAEIGDEFFQLSMRECVDRQNDLSHELTQLYESPLSTQHFKKNQEGSKLDKYDRTIIRVLLPNRLVLQGVFCSGEPVKSLVGYIKSCLADPKLKFHLFTAPPKRVIKNGKVTFKEANLVPACNVHLALEETAEGLLLREELLDQVSTQLEADVKSSRERAVPPATPMDTAGVASPAAGYQGGRGKQGKVRSGTKSQGKPKWLKIGK